MVSVKAESPPPDLVREVREEMLRLITANAQALAASCTEACIQQVWAACLASCLNAPEHLSAAAAQPALPQAIAAPTVPLVAEVAQEEVGGASSSREAPAPSTAEADDATSPVSFAAALSQPTSPVSKSVSLDPPQAAESPPEEAPPEPSPPEQSVEEAAPPAKEEQRAEQEPAVAVVEAATEEVATSEQPLREEAAEDVPAPHPPIEEAREAREEEPVREEAAAAAPVAESSSSSSVAPPSQLPPEPREGPTTLEEALSPGSATFESIPDDKEFGEKEAAASPTSPEQDSEALCHDVLSQFRLPAAPEELGDMSEVTEELEALQAVIASFVDQLSLLGQKVHGPCPPPPVAPREECIAANEEADWAAERQAFQEWIARARTQADSLIDLERSRGEASRPS